MTMAPEEALAMARECAEISVSAKLTALMGNDFKGQIPKLRARIAKIRCAEGDHLPEVQSALLAIDRMQERVRAETQRCEGIVASRMKTLAALGGSFASQRFMEAEMILKAIRETPHAEG